jgi:SNF2 family DNA or RNA helicase
MHADLYAYQRTGAEFLAARQFAMLADDPGIGKTPQAIAAADAAAVQTAVVLCPGIARENWAREFRRWQTVPRVVEVVYRLADLDTFRVMCADVLVLSYNILADKKVRMRLKKWRFDALICDEAHALKEPTSLRSRAVYGHRFDRQYGVAHSAKRVWLLTGTPVLNHPGELWTHIKALWPETITDVCGLGRSAFMEHFCAFDGLTGRPVGPRRAPLLRSLLQPHVLRRLQADVQAELPALRWEHATVSPETLPPMPPELAEAQQVIMSAIASAAGDDAALAVAEANKMHLATLRKWTGVAKAPAVVELIRDGMAAGATPVVVFAIHKDVMAVLHKGLPGSRVLSGDTKMADRQALIDDFQAGRITALICQMSIASTALTLTRSNNVVFAEPSWVPADMQQAAKRCHRIGQALPVLAKVISLAGSIDEVVADVLTRKTATITKLDLAVTELSVHKSLEAAFPVVD